ncbi:WAT1-related protein [Dioscorea alata]|uniref:WAT1-related protein n=1 Tax=Dioscorea alata TaxID=55571 RepID=A0ACB7WVX3_DIOAL|nr:WAT1-related protein [Dioscorea alata]
MERINRLKDPICIIFVQLFAMGMLLLSKISLNQGMFVFTLLVYRNFVGFIFLIPFSLYFERDLRNRLSWKAIFWIFITALLWIPVALGLYYYGLKDTTATYSSNFLNLIPIGTFIFAVIFRLEKLGLRKTSGKVKLGGTLLCVAGAMVLSLYKGKTFYIWSSHKNHVNTTVLVKKKHNWTRGTLFLVASCLGYSFWFLAQAKLSTIFQAKYSATMLVGLFGSLQSLIAGISINREKSTWKLGWNFQLLTIFYSGILSTGATFCLLSYVIARRGPTYPSMFNPLAITFTMIIESFFMGQELSVGSLLGMVMIIGGLYAFLWGKEKEAVKASEDKDVCPDIESSIEEQVSYGETKVSSSSNIGPQSIVLNGIKASS